MKRLTLNLEPKIAGRIESTARNMGTTPESLCLYAICEQLEELQHIESPVFLADRNHLEFTLNHLQKSWIDEKYMFQDYWLQISELKDLRREGKLSAEDFENKIDSISNGLNDHFNQL